jgi:hypothetical protein
MQVSTTNGGTGNITGMLCPTNRLLVVLLEFFSDDEFFFINRLQVDKAVQFERMKYYMYTSYCKLSIRDLVLFKFREVALCPKIS